MTDGPRAVHPELADAVADLLDVADRHVERPGVLPIVQAGDPVLRRPAAPYTGQLGDVLPRLLAAMRRTMHAAPGVGLAAPQVGIGLAIAVCEDPGVPDDPRDRRPLPYRVLVNPRYAPVVGPAADGADDTGDDDADHAAFYEGCLSVAGWQAVVARPRRIRLTCQDEHGDPVEEVLSGWPARIVQHETDHLAGRLYLDRAETRSLASSENLLRHFGPDPDPGAAASALGFGLPGRRPGS